MNKVSILSWNVQGKKNFTGYTSFGKIKSHLVSSKFDILILQEFPDAKNLIGNIDEFRGFNTFIPELNSKSLFKKEGCNNNVVISKYPIIDSYEISFSELNSRAILENCSVVDIKIADKVLRVYSCHFGIFKVGISTRLKQLEKVLSDSLNHKGPTIICGDLNSTIPKHYWNRKIIRAWHQEPKKEMVIGGQFFQGDERELFNQKLNEASFREVFDLYTPTWSPFKSKVWEMFKLKLDWLAVRDMAVLDSKLGEYVSDHKSMQIDVSLRLN